jgi:murein L,D-transpeptidase YcbB/YkuD
MKPGPQNPLGRIKFMFPNRFAVYLHDTPERYLFARDIRSYSSGCIRVERPLDLAQYLLEKATEWDCDMILDTLEADKPLTVNLPASWPIHILYWTAWVDEEGALQFRNDFYLRDLDLELALIRSLEKTKSEAGKMLTAGS